MAARKKPAVKRGASRAPAATAAGKPVHPIVWIIVGALVAVFVMTLMGLEPGKKTEAPVAAAQPSAKPKQNQATEINQNKPKFEFYTILPESEGIVPPTPEQPVTAAPLTAAQQEQQRKAEAERAQAILDGKTPPPRIEPPTPSTAPANQSGKVLYFLQAGSFPTKDQAETVRAKLIMSGQDVRIEQGLVGDKTWHRVMVGPFASQDQLKSAQTQLAGNGFNNLLPQQRKAN